MKKINLSEVKRLKRGFILVIALSLIAFSQVVSAGVITCGVSGVRTASLDSAEECKTGSGNPQGDGSTIGGHYGGTWTNVGNETSSGIGGMWFDVSLTSGSWGGGDAAGKWTISAAFWATYADAVISMHVGNGPASVQPDHWAWRVTDNATSGNWSYDFISGQGGGLSNLHLWGRGQGTTIVPEPSFLALFGLGLFCLVFLRRSIKG